MSKSALAKGAAGFILSCCGVAQALLQAEPHSSHLLTPGQLEILTLLAGGYASKQIGRDLGLSAKIYAVRRGLVKA